MTAPRKQALLLLTTALAIGAAWAGWGLTRPHHGTFLQAPGRAGERPAEASILAFVCGCSTCKELLTLTPPEVRADVTAVTSMSPGDLQEIGFSKLPVGKWHQDDYDAWKERLKVAHCPTLVITDQTGVARNTITHGKRAPADMWKLAVADFDKLRPNH